MGAKRRGVFVTMETDLFVADFVVTSFKPTWKRQAKHSNTEARVLSASAETITIYQLPNKALQSAKSRVAERETTSR